MSYHVDDTIVAIASAMAGGARGIVRVSGPETVRFLARCFQAADGSQLADVSLPNGSARPSSRYICFLQIAP